MYKTFAFEIPIGAALSSERSRTEKYGGERSSADTFMLAWMYRAARKEAFRPMNAAEAISRLGAKSPVYRQAVLDCRKDGAYVL